MSEPPLQVLYHRQERTLEIVDTAQRHRISADYLRQHSLSAAAQGPAAAGCAGDMSIAIDHIEPCGLYALRIHFSDGHRSGLYSYDYLRRLAARQSGKD